MRCVCMDNPNIVSYSIHIYNNYNNPFLEFAKEAMANQAMDANEVTLITLTTLITLILMITLITMRSSMSAAVTTISTLPSHTYHTLFLSLFLSFLDKVSHTYIHTHIYTLSLSLYIYKVINVRWAYDDPNPNAGKRINRENQDKLAERLTELGHDKHGYSDVYKAENYMPEAVGQGIMSLSIVGFDLLYFTHIHSITHTLSFFFFSLLDKALPTHTCSLSLSIYLSLCIYIYMYMYVCKVYLRRIVLRSPQPQVKPLPAP